jgi:hypothetical protein
LDALLDLGVLLPEVALQVGQLEEGRPGLTVANDRPADHHLDDVPGIEQPGPDVLGLLFSLKGRTGAPELKKAPDCAERPKLARWPNFTPPFFKGREK